MKPNKLLLSVFILVAIAQLFVPWQMISKHVGYADKGSEFKFKTSGKFNSANNRAGAFVAGKFIRLHFEEDHIKISDKKEWESNHGAYVLFNQDSAGFAKIKSVTKEKPENSSDWIRATVWCDWKDTTSLILAYPFNNYNIEDRNHKGIDSIVKYGLNDSLKVNYLKIKIRENQFLVNDLWIDGKPFKEIVGPAKKFK